DLSHAISLLGRKTIRNLVLSISIYNTFTPEGKKHEKQLAAFWQHSLACATTAETVAQITGYPQTEEAFIGGLLHDIGKLIAFIRFPEEFGLFLNQLQQQNKSGGSDTPPLELEDKILGISHHQLGKWTAERWNFPENIINAVWLHHQPITSFTKKTDRLPAIIRFADAFCNIHHLGSNYFINREIDLPCHSNHMQSYDLLKKFFKIDDDDITDILSLTIDRLDEFAETLDLSDDQRYFDAIKHANRELGRMNVAHEQALNELQMKKRVLKGIYHLDRKISQHHTPAELARIIIQTTIDTYKSDLALCFLKTDDEQLPVGLGYANKTFFNPQDWLSHDNQQREKTVKVPPQQRKALDSIEKILLSPDIFLTSEKITPLLPRSSLLAVPLTYHAGKNKGIIGQLILDCRKMIPYGGGRESLLQGLHIFAAAIANNVHKVMLFDNLNQQSEELADLQRQTEQMQEQLYLSQRLATVGRLAAGAAHEINNPLAVISANIQVLLRKANDAGNRKKESTQYQTILQQTSKISKIITDLVTYAHPAKPHMQAANIQQIVTQSLAAVDHRAAFKKIKLKNELPKDLPRLNVDTMQIGQVLINLLINAEQAMPDGGTITITGKKEGDHVLLQVADTGQGIPPEQQTVIFDPFFTTREAGQGTGLGLAICHSLMEQNNGKIGVKSLVGSGTTFSLFLPKSKENHNPISEALQQSSAGDGLPGSGNELQPRILFVEHGREMGPLLSEELSSSGYQLETADSSLKAIETIKGNVFDLLIIDLDMGVRATRQILRWLNKFFNNLPVIVLTGLNSMEQVEKLKDFEISSYHQKPFQVETLLKSVTELINRPANE
ncbi:MAG: HDOD domain-containing protein, partial [Deltaproteobacteria bacterium]|nr:HDOD domain-containing protein [Deltaproteobacteria bacterium]